MIEFLQGLRVIAGSPWITLSSLLLTIVSLFLAVNFYLKGRKQKLPRYALRSSSLVRDLVNKVQGLEMLYSGRHVENLTVSRIAFWNAGRDTISNADVASTDPVIVNIEGGAKILDAKIVYVKNSANKFRISKSSEETKIQIEFEYIDQHEGLIIQFFHTATDDKQITVKGSIKGAQRSVRVFVETRVEVPHPIPPPPGFPVTTVPRKSMGLALILIPLGGVLFAAMLGVFSEHHNWPHGWGLLVILGVGAAYVLTGIALFRRRVPRGFEEFEKDF
jgi:hypothetical protein